MANRVWTLQLYVRTLVRNSGISLADNAAKCRLVGSSITILRGSAGSAEHAPITIPSYTGDNPSELTEREYIDYFIKYNGDNTFDSAKLGLEINNWFDAEWDYNTMTIYKNNDELIFVKDTNSKPKCAVTKNIFKFCATPTTQLYVANQYSSLPQLFSPQIKFALFMDDLPPRPIKDLNAYDRQKSDKHLILEWGKLNDQDLKYYSIIIYIPVI